MPDDEFPFNKSVPILHGRFWNEVFNFQIFTAFSLRPLIPIRERELMISHREIASARPSKLHWADESMQSFNFLFIEGNISF